MADPHDPDRARRGVLEVLAAAALFGTTGTSASLAPPSAGSASIGAARLVIGGAGLVVALPWLGGSRRRALALWRTPWGMVAGLATALYQLGFFAGVSMAGVALATLVTIGSSPIMVGLLSRAVLGERLRGAWWLATVVCVGGLGLLTVDGGAVPGVEVAGLAFSLLAALSYAAYTVAAKRLMRDGTAPAEVMASCFGLGALVLAPVLVLSAPAWLATVPGLLVATWLGLGTTTGAYVLFGRGLQALTAGPAATLVLAEPLVATLLGVVVVGERLGPMGWAGAGLVAGGLAIQGLAAARDRGDAEPNVVETGLA